jgi:acyl transferase domain-containing protein
MVTSIRQIEELIIEEIVAVSGLKASAISSGLGFAEMGIESLQAVHIVSRLNEKLKDVLEEPLSPILMFDFPNVNALAKSIFEAQRGQAPAPSVRAEIKIRDQQEAISIVGMSCRMPGAANLSEFYKVLVEGRDCIRKIGKSRVGAFTQPIDTLGMVDEVDLFANGVFGITENEARRMDPQHRILLEETWHAIEDAGFAPSEWRGQAVGVYVGISSSDYSRALQGAQYADIFSATGNAHSIAANRISYLFDFKGPSIAIDTACSSSLVALNMAVQALRSGQIDWAVCAGANLVLNPELSQAFADAMMLSPDGRCFTFSQRANGYVRGEGVGVVILRRKSDAEKDKCRIYAEVLSATVNQDGRSSSLTAPNGKAQEAVILDALREANLQPGDISYHEAHGTGTALGDPIEYLALERVHAGRAPEKPLIVGSVKTNIGHLEAAAGVAGIIKTALALHHKTFFPHLHFDVINPQIGTRAKNVKVGTALQEWPAANGETRKASVSSFGFGGTNAHAILAEGPTEKLEAFENDNGQSFPLALSSDSDEGLNLLATSLKIFLEKDRSEKLPKIRVRDLSSRLLRTRTDLPEKLIFSARGSAEAEEILNSYLKGAPGTEKRIRKTARARTTLAGVTFLFTGQGAQYTKMYSPLYNSDPVFKDRVDRLFRQAQNFIPQSLFAIWFEDGLSEKISETGYGQILLFIFELAFAQHVESRMGRRPDFVFGHSLGEIIAAAYAGHLDINEALNLIIVRAHLMQKTKQGAMLAVYSTMEKINQVISSQRFAIDFAANNGPGLQVVSGEENEIVRLEKVLQDEKIKFKRMLVRQAFHSRLMDEVLDVFVRSIGNIHPRKGSIPLISSLSGKVVASGETVSTIFGEVDAMGSDYWRAQLRAPTQFENAVLTLADLRSEILIELGPQAVLSSMAQRFYPLKSSEWIHFFNRDDDSLTSYVKGIEALAQLSLIASPLPDRRSNLPLSQWKRKRFWIDAPQPLLQTVAAETKKPEDREKNMKQNMDQRFDEVLTKLVEVMAQAMKVTPAEVDVNESLVDLGADSLVLLNAVQTIKDTYHVSIPISEVFKDLNNLTKIAKFIVHETQEAASAQVQDPVLTIPAFALPVSDGPRDAGVLLNALQGQIAMLSQQLGMIASMGTVPQAAPQASPQSATSLSSSVIKVGPEEKRGVLGNFKTFVERDNKREDSDEKERYVTGFISRFNARTKNSKSHAQKYRSVLADNRVSAGFRPTTKEMTYPIHFVKAKGSHFTDLDGNDLIDFTMGFGVNLFGHSPDFIQEKLFKQLEAGMAVGPQSHLAGEVAELICEITGHERVAFVNSGTEAVMTAIRLARAATKKSKIVIFDGSYHGHFDGVLARGLADLRSIPVAAGITTSTVQDIVVLEYGNEASLKYVRDHAAELAAVLVEPVQSRFPEHQPKEFLQKMREITREGKVAFIWDEVICGFRIKPGGAQEHFGVKGDLAAYGKVLGGGMPIGAVAGNHKYMDFIDGGGWRFGDASIPENEMTFFAGTFCKHPLAMAAALATLQKLKKEGQQIISELNLTTDSMVSRLNQFFKSVGVEIKVYNFGSLFRFKANLNLDLFFASLNEQGIYVWEGRNLFMSTAHTAQDISQFELATQKATRTLMESGHFKSSKRSYALTAYQNRFFEISKFSDNGALASQICVSAKVKGILHKDSLQKALEIIARSRDLFRLRIDLKSGRQEFADHDVPIDFAFVNLREETRPWKVLDKQLHTLAQEKIEVQAEPPIRFRLYDVVEETHVFAVLCHHLAFDGWTMTLFFKELAEVYNALIAGQQPQVAHQLTYQEYLNTNIPVRDDARKYWLETFASGVPKVEFPLEGRKHEAPYKGERIVFDLELKLYDALKAWSAKNKLTPFMFLYGAFVRALMRKLQISEIVIGIPSAHRDLPGSERMYGNCTNVLPIWIKDDQVDAVQYFKMVKEKIIRAYQNMDYPYEDVKKVLGPLFQVYFNLEPTSDLPEFDHASLIIHPYPIAASELPLMLNVTDFEHYYHCEFDFQLCEVADDFVLELIDEMKKMVREILQESKAAGSF